jgi:hypothetical protein
MKGATHAEGCRIASKTRTKFPLETRVAYLFPKALEGPTQNVFKVEVDQAAKGLPLRPSTTN